jgi:alkylation response protein AidB-like acyl-CoA dehydrogenase
MEWGLSEDLNMIRAAARDFAEREVLPNRSAWDENQVLPR